MKTWVLAVILSGPGIGLLWFMWRKFFPEEKKRNLGLKVGRFISFFGRKKLGRNSWEDVENKLEGEVSSFLGYVRQGMNEDDLNGNGNGNGSKVDGHP